jgi:hypothetical protein
MLLKGVKDKVATVSKRKKRKGFNDSFICKRDACAII